MEPLTRPTTTTNNPYTTRNDYYDTPEGHDQAMEYMRNSMGNNAVGAAAGGELQPGRATGGATLTALGGEASPGGGQPPSLTELVNKSKLQLRMRHHMRQWAERSPTRT